jgi:hypothetical protein
VSLNPLGPAVSAHRSHRASPCSRSSARPRLTLAATRGRKCARGSNGQAPAFTAFALYPDFNPIENAFAKLKALLRKAAERTVDGLRTAIGRIVDLFVQTNVETTSSPQDTMQRDRLSAEGVAVLLPRKVEERAVLRQPVARLGERAVVFLQPGQT